MKCLRDEMERIREEDCQIMRTGMEESSVTIKVFADASFGNVEGVKTQIRFYVRLADGLGNRSPIIWKSKVARRVIGSTLAAEVACVV